MGLCRNGFNGGSCGGIGFKGTDDGGGGGHLGGSGAEPKEHSVSVEDITPKGGRECDGINGPPDDRNTDELFLRFFHFALLF